MKGKTKNILRLLTVLLLILSVAGSSFFIENEQKINEKEKTEAAAREQNKEANEIVKPAKFFAIVTVLHFDVAQELYVIFNLNFLENLQEEPFFTEPYSISRYFKNLFCFVISPNAP
ncbi:MAG: hypothetical protein K2X86_18490 [Cytophagaceae bacterium]|nr:hypothetical protein [Cytophagaceae bacterium]